MQRGRSDEAARLRRMPLRGPNVHGLVDRRDLPRMRRHSERVLGGRFRKCLRPYGVIAVDDPVVLPRRRMRGRGQRLVLLQAMTRRVWVRSSTTTAIDEPDTRLPASGTSEEIRLRLVTSRGSPYPSRSPRAHPSGWTRTQGNAASKFYDAR